MVSPRLGAGSNRGFVIPPVLIRAVNARATRLGGAGVDMPALIEWRRERGAVSRGVYVT